MSDPATLSTRPDGPRPGPHVIVVGAGISGLAAAFRLLSSAGQPLRVSVLDGAPAVGGKLALQTVAGAQVDAGGEALLATVPTAVALAKSVGLTDDLVDPGTTSALLWSRGRHHPLPPGTVMGIPSDLGAVTASRLFSSLGLARIPLDLVLARTEIGEDMSVGGYVAARLGREVVDRLVDPLLGGVYAGRADELSLEATVPQLAPAAREHRSLIAAARAAKAAAAKRSSGGPVFAGIRGGVGRLPIAVADAVRRLGGEVRPNAMVRGLAARPGGGWRLVVGSAADPAAVDADAVILAVPAGPAARLLGDLAPAVAGELGGIDYASMALVTFAFERGSVDLPAGSGFLVPPVDARVVKAATFLGRKWPWVEQVAPELDIVRCSVGRHGEPEHLQRDDDELIAACRSDLVAALGPRGRVVDATVTRWGGALPQYAVGHRTRVARVREGLGEHPTLAVCGAAYQGIGVAACVGSATAAADHVLRALADRARIDA